MITPKIAPDEKLGPWKLALFLLRVGVARDDLGFARDELFFCGLPAIGEVLGHAHPMVAFESIKGCPQTT